MMTTIFRNKCHHNRLARCFFYHFDACLSCIVCVYMRRAISFDQFSICLDWGRTRKWINFWWNYYRIVKYHLSSYTGRFTTSARRSSSWILEISKKIKFRLICSLDCIFISRGLTLEAARSTQLTITILEHY